MAEPMNRESMTLLEWHCAACSPGGSNDAIRKAADGNNYTRDVLGIYGPARGLRRSDVGAKHYNAWKAGEDPTEWRAYYEALRTS